MRCLSSSTSREIWSGRFDSISTDAVRLCRWRNKLQNLEDALKWSETLRVWVMDGIGSTYWDRCKSLTNYDCQTCDTWDIDLVDLSSTDDLLWISVGEKWELHAFCFSSFFINPSPDTRVSFYNLQKISNLWRKLFNWEEQLQLKGTKKDQK